MVRRSHRDIARTSYRLGLAVIELNAFSHQTAVNSSPLLQYHSRLTQPLHRAEIVTDEQHRAPVFPRHVFHFAEALLLKLGVADRQHFVHNEDLLFQMRRYGKRQTHIYAAAIAFHRHVEEFLDLGEGHYFIELFPNLRASHSQNGAVQEDGFMASQFRMEASANLQQTGDAPTQPDAALGGLGNLR